jgi:hypothetical protein
MTASSKSRIQQRTIRSTSICIQRVFGGTESRQMRQIQVKVSEARVESAL